MSKFVALTLLLIIFSTPTTSASKPDVSNFAEKLKTAILTKDRESLKNFGCLPTPNQCFNEYIASYLFGSGEGEGEISKVLQNPNIQVKIFGPYTHEDRYKNSSYAIVFYDSAINFFLENGLMRPELVENEWNKGYVHTVVTELGGEVYLHRTLFFYGAHLPWVDDY